MTYSAEVSWETSKQAGRFTRTGQTEKQIEEIKRDLREHAPQGSTHVVKVTREN